MFLLALSSGLRVSQPAALSADSPLLHFGDDNDYVSLAPHPHESHHMLCPVGALHAYLTSDPPPPGGRIWRWPWSNRPCSSSHLTAVICKAIREAFVRSYDHSQIQEAGQLASSRTFVHCYLWLPLQDLPCVALGSGPSTDVGHLPTVLCFCRC